MASRPPASSDQDHRRALHFYPAAYKLIWFVDGESVIVARAWGGVDPTRGVHYDVMNPQRTTPGRYVIDSYGPHVTKTWKHSKIAWGTRLMVSSEGHLLYETGLASHPWRLVEERVRGFTFEDAKRDYHALYGDDAGIPDRWVFNDFGPLAVRYFVDKNRNHRRDRNEPLSGEMIHTTPENEAEVSRGSKARLFPSHGCIHVDPIERDRLHVAGAFERGTDLLIHGYNEPLPESMW